VQIIVLNQQRQRKISLSDMKVMTQKLSLAVLTNLEQNKPFWLTTKMLAAIKAESALNLIIVSKQAIRKLNKKWLSKDSETDVLSFPLIDLTESSQLNNENLQPLGEIFIAYEKAREQAKAFNHSVDRELAFLFVHGMLHILGFDHQDKNSEKDMFDRQKRVLRQAGYPRQKR
jgi:probable rRNA maturation factor